MYQVSKIQISKTKQPELFEYFDECCRLSKNLYNAALFRLRQRLTGYAKEKLTGNERQVADEITLTAKTCGIEEPRKTINYKFLEKIMRVTKNPDFFAGLSSHASQHVLKDACEDMKTFFKSVKAYNADNKKFNGKPELPRYKKTDKRIVKFTNQVCTIKDNKLGFPKTKFALELAPVNDTYKLKEVQVVPCYGIFEVIAVFENSIKPQKSKGAHKCGIDFGVNNLAAIVSNNNHCLLYKGSAVKSVNQWFNKERARLISMLDKQCLPKTSKRLDKLSVKRSNYLNNYMHQVSADIIKFCIKNDIGTIVIGKNQGWKEEVNLGNKTNQNFVAIPFNKLQWMIQYKAENAGIKVIYQEESYTSKASFLAGDVIPVYKKGVNVSDGNFSGRRVKRGLYKNSNGVVLNADINGAANILRKAVDNAFDGITDYTYLERPIVQKVYC